MDGFRNYGAISGGAYDKNTSKFGVHMYIW